MITILAWWGRAVRRWPVTLVMVLVVATAGLGLAAAGRVTDIELSAYSVAGPRADALAEVHERFGIGGTSNKIQVVVDAGPAGDVITAAGMAEATRIASVLQAIPEVVAALAETAAPIVSFAMPAERALATVGVDLAGADTAIVDTAMAAALADPLLGAEAARLFSLDLGAAAARARAGLVVVTLDPGIAPSLRRDAGVAAREAVGALESDYALSTISHGIVSDDLARGVAAELPRLLLAALALIALVVGFAFRRLSDVLIAVFGLVAAVVWMIGVGVILGPDGLGVIGAFTSISNAVPVLLVGLGVDYAVQLTYRYREERILGEEVGLAATKSISTVGMALVLATVTTIVGFLTNLTSPVSPIRDFGVLTAVGIAAAFVVMVTLVPAARVVLDRRDDSTAIGRSYAFAHRGPLVRLLRASTWLSRRVPVLTVIVALGVAGFGLWSASSIPTSFSRETFIPRGSGSATAMRTLDVLFGGNVNERTFLVVSGDLARPSAVTAMSATLDRMAGDPDILVHDGAVVAESPVSVLRNLARDDPAFAAAAAAMGWDGVEMRSDADVAGVYDLARSAAPLDMGRVLATDDAGAVISVATTAGEARAGDLAAALEADSGAMIGSRLDVLVTSDALMVGETNRALTASQGRTIFYALGIATLLLVLHFWIAVRRPILGLLTMISTTLTVAWILGTMHLLGMSFNVLTVTIAAVAVGIGVDYAIHMTHRFTEEAERRADLGDAVTAAVTHTGSALAVSAATTAIGFGVLSFSGIEPVRQFGAITALTIVYAFLGAVLVQPAVLRLWVAWRRRGERTTGIIQPEAADHSDG